MKSHHFTVLTLAATGALFAILIVQDKRRRAKAVSVAGREVDSVYVTQDNILGSRILGPSPLEPPGWGGEPASGDNNSVSVPSEEEGYVVVDSLGQAVDHQAVSWFTVPVTTDNRGMLKHPGQIAKTIGYGGVATTLSAQNDVSQLGDDAGGLPAGISGF